jgi:uncharacterized protein YecE (DUF72 family)
MMKQDLQSHQQSILVGVGGWAYLPIKKGNKLQVCSKLYDFVEVNSTFYSLPEVERVKKWKKTVPETFEFTLRANRELTHVGQLKPTTKNFKIFEQMLEIAKELDAKIIHLQFPPSLVVSKPIVKDWQDFFRSVQSKAGGRSELRFALELRSSNAKNCDDLAKLIQEYDLIPTTDASKDLHVKASSDSKIVYTRVFGLGDHTKWSFDSHELKTLGEKVEGVKARRRYVTFHNLTMYEDASRMRTIIRTGKDQERPRNAPLGLSSLKQVIAASRPKYPVTKQKLIDDFRWKTFDRDPGERVHIVDVLQKLDDRSYRSVEDVIGSLERLNSAS